MTHHDASAPAHDEHRLTLVDRLGLWSVLRGLSIILKHFFQKKATREYPEEPTIPIRDFRGEHCLTVDEDGRMNCVACFMCSTACPSRCIEIVAEPAPADWPRDKRAKVFNIDMLRCIYCGMCEEACPVDAIALTSHYYEVATSRLDKIYDKDRLIANNKFYDKPVKRPKWTRALGKS